MEKIVKVLVDLLVLAFGTYFVMQMAEGLIKVHKYQDEIFHGIERSN